MGKKYFYIAEENRLLQSSANADAPEGAVEISEETYAEMLAALASGLMVSEGESGQPEAKPYPIFYSPTNKGFYTVPVHGDAIPEDAIEVEAEDHKTLLTERAQGKSIVPGEDGYPVLAIIPLDEDQVRAKRDALLNASDWVATRAFETGEDVPANWAQYRQALRDIPEQAGFPASVTWPTAP